MNTLRSEETLLLITVHIFIWKIKSNSKIFIEGQIVENIQISIICL